MLIAGGSAAVVFLAYMYFESRRHRSRWDTGRRRKRRRSSKPKANRKEVPEVEVKQPEFGEGS